LLSGGKSKTEKCPQTEGKKQLNKPKEERKAHFCAGKKTKIPF